MAVWPFLREGIATIAARMELPVPVLGLMKQGQANVIDDSTRVDLGNEPVRHDDQVIGRVKSSGQRPTLRSHGRAHQGLTNRYCTRNQGFPRTHRVGSAPCQRAAKLRS